MDDFTNEICKNLQINMKTHRVRLWLKPRGEDWRLLLNSEKDSNSSGGGSSKSRKVIEPLTLEDVDMASGDFIMVEADDKKKKKDATYDDDGGGSSNSSNSKRTWPRDLIQLQIDNFRDFEINSKVDALDRENKWYSGKASSI